MNYLRASAVIIYNLQFLTRTELAQAKRWEINLLQKSITMKIKPQMDTDELAACNALCICGYNL